MVYTSKISQRSISRSISKRSVSLLFSVAAATAALAPALLAQTPTTNPLVTGKSITPRDTNRQSVGSLPMNMILTPDGKYAVTSDMGFRQSLWTVDTRTGRGVSHLDFPNHVGASRTPDGNGLYYGLAVAANNDGAGGSTLYVSQGNKGTVAILTVGADGTLTDTGRTITGQPGDFFAGVAADGAGHLYVAVNEKFTLNPAGYDPTAFAKPSSLAIYSLATSQQLGRYTFNSLTLPSTPFRGGGGLPPVPGPAMPPSFPLSVAALADGTRVYVTNQRDGGVYVLDTSNPASPTPAVSNLIETGSHPDALLLNQAQTLLYVANAHSDTVTVLNTADNSQAATISLRPNGAQTLPGVTPTGLALSPDERTLYATLGDMNAVAVVNLASNNVSGYIPVGWYPTGVVTSPFKKQLLVSNAKGTQTRNPNKTAQGPNGANGTYILNIIEGNVSTVPVPNATDLLTETRQVLANNRITALTATPANPLAGIGLAAGKIKHVVYIVKENRTYDQVLGDLKDTGGNPLGNGDPSLTLFGDSPTTHVTPNQHALARRFVLLDNFYDCAEASGDGWPWSTQGQANEYVIKNLPYNYSGRGRNYDFEGSNNFYPTGGFPATDPYGGPYAALTFPTGASAIPDIAEAPGGHIWDDMKNNLSLSNTGLTTKYRNYGFFYTLTVVRTGLVPDNYPASAGLQPAGHDLSGISDYDFREFDLNYADSEAPALNGTPYKTPTFSYNPAATPGTTAATPGTASISRFTEFKKEFGEMLAQDSTGNSVPAFTMVRFMSDHTEGSTAGAPSPRAHVADNDYAVGQFVDLISHSPIWNSTAIFVIEDDAQDGQDHVDAHRSTCYVISPFIKQASVDHTFYNTDSVLKTMELLLNVPPMNQYDATATPILDFDLTASNGAPYAVVPYDPAIIGEKNPTMAALKPGTEAYHLARLAAKMDLVHPDSAPADQLNEMAWKSVKGMNSRVPAPRHSGLLLTRATSPKSATHSAAKDRDGD